MKDPNINIEALKAEAISMAARLLTRTEIQTLYGICETQKTVSTRKIYRQLEKHANHLSEVSYMIAKLSDQL